MAMTRQVVRTKGFKELAAALNSLEKGARQVMQRALRTAAVPMEADMKRRIAVRTGVSRDSLTVSSEINTGKQLVVGKVAGYQSGQSIETWAEMHIGPAAYVRRDGKTVWNAAPTMLELGTIYNAARPFMRPAWDANKTTALKTIERELWAELEAVAQAAPKSGTAADTAGDIFGVAQPA